MPSFDFDAIAGSASDALLDIRTHVPGPKGSLPITAEMLLAIRNVIRKISPSGAVSILAGAPDEPGVADGPAQVARFGGLTGLALDPQGNLVAADATRIRKIDLSTGIVTTLAGSVRPLSLEFTGRQAVDALGNVFVVTSPTATQPSYGVRKITAAGVATMVAPAFWKIVSV